MINTSNYYTVIKGVDVSKLPSELKELTDFVNEVTSNGKTWDMYKSESDIKTTIDTFFVVLDDHLKYESKQKSNAERRERNQSNEKEVAPKSKPTPKEKVVKTTMNVIKQKGEQVEKIAEEISIIRRYVKLHNKLKSLNQIRLFLGALQKAIVEKRIRKTSKYAKEIREIQDQLIDLMNAFKGKESELIQVGITESKLSHYYNLVGKQELMLSVRFIKSYIGLQGKIITNLKATSLYNKIARAIQNKQLLSKDVYWHQIENILDSLKSFVKKNARDGRIIISSQELNGLENIVSVSTGKDGLNGFDCIPDHLVVDSTDIINMQFDKLDFEGKWRAFIGNPSKGFSTMVFGKPKFGKSTLCIDFAGYLARNHGNVLYIAREERVGDTIKEKLQQTNVAHPNLQFVGAIPSNLSKWNFVFLDSVTKLGLTPSDLERLQNTYPSISFIYVFQTTKQGNFRGENGYQHDVDVVIDVPEKGIATQYGRFNQGSQMEIFNSDHEIEEQEPQEEE